MSDATATAEDLLDQVGFTSEHLPHPVEFLTIEMAASKADVSHTTVDSAVLSADSFRSLTLEAAIRSVTTAPDETVWEALQQSVGGTESGPAIAAVFAARSKQLAGDPAFPLLLSGFERLDDDRTAIAVNSALRSLVSELWPFVQTICSATGLAVPPAPSEAQLFSWMTCLLADALRRAVLPDERPDATDAFGIIISDLLFADVSSSTADEDYWGLLPPEQVPAPIPLRGLAVEALEAGVDLLRASAIHPATSLTVAEVVRRCGLSTSGFYTVFGSIVEFERLALRRVGGSLASGFQQHFYEDELVELEGAPTGGQPGAAETFASYYALTEGHHRSNAAGGRPGVELLPWLRSPSLAGVIARSFEERFEERGKFFERLMVATGVQAADGLSAAEVASFMGVLSVVVEFLTRNAPEGGDLDRFLAARSSDYFARLFEVTDVSS